LREEGQVKRVLPPLLFLGVVFSGGCQEELPPAGQFVVFVDTDAVVREVRGKEPDSLALSPLVDRARFEVSSDGKPVPNSTRDVAVDAAMLREKRLSFGVVAPAGARAVTVRVRLFRADRVSGSEPESGVTLDTTVALPPTPAEGIAPVNVLLTTDDMGTQVGPIAPASGPPTRSAVGTWRGGKRVECGEGARPGETCIPGASFFFGNPAFRGRASQADIYEERLVWVSQFFLDSKEVTVGAFRARWAELQARGIAEPIAKAADAYCTWTAAPEGENENRALNCVSWNAAFAYCESMGRTLPSEAQFELVQSGLGEEWSFPWGNDEPGCTGTVWGCAGDDAATLDAIRRGADECRVARGAAGPYVSGQGQIDKLSSAVLRNAGGDDVLDLGGNVSEWSRDVWARPTDAYWSPVRPMVDPLNTEPNALDGDSHAVRGGDWASTVLTTRAGFRRRRPTAEVTPLTGFRCARPAPPR
jgi:formylglycine-generating enzyme required for sulfatase activity